MAKRLGWTHKLWRERDVENGGLPLSKVWFNETSPYGRSDIARAAILYKHGGLYADCDVEWCGTDPELLMPLSAASFIATTENDWPTVRVKYAMCVGAPTILLTTGVMFVAPKSPSLGMALEQMPAHYYTNKPLGTADTLGTFLVSRYIVEPIYLVPRPWLIYGDDYQGKRFCKITNQ